MKIGIEALNIFGGSAFIDVKQLANHRQLDTARFDNLLMKQKAVPLLFEDPVTCAVNAAKPIVDALSQEEKNDIELLITCSESGVDFGKSISTYVHHHLGLRRTCRMFEIKQACYSGTAGLQMAINFVLSNTSPGAKALIVATDITRVMTVEGSDTVNMDWSFAEPSNGAGASALLVSDQASIMQIDIGANGYYGFEVMDTCRPVPDSEAGDSDLSLMSYLDCSLKSFQEYQRRVEGVDYRRSFQYLSFHTPFGGMVKGAHRHLMRKVTQTCIDDIEKDFQHRVVPGLKYCQRVGNIMGGTIFLSLASTIDNGKFDAPKRIGLFSYGSGCCSEFYSGVVTPVAQTLLQRFQLKQHLDQRFMLNMDEYDAILQASHQVQFGTRNVMIDCELIPGALNSVSTSSRKQLILREIRDFHRKYEWI